MKPVAFDYARPRTIEEAVRLLAGTPDAKVLAGGQTLGPMLNLRLAQPSLLVDITRIAELSHVEETPDAIALGSTVTHAAIEDGRIEDPSYGFLSRVAHGIAYRAVRTRGTVGGSLAHADPAADWLSCFIGLGAEVVIAGPGGRRREPLAAFVRGALDTDLGPDELLLNVRIPRLSARARCGYNKICRKKGEFAEAIGVAVHDPERGVFRLVAGSTDGRPIVIEREDLGVRGADLHAVDAVGIEERLRQAGLGEDAYELKIHAAALRREVHEALAA
jgi:aerobic carbon-monoxide dehydrogenase medium subunit